MPDHRLRFLSHQLFIWFLIGFALCFGLQTLPGLSTQAPALTPAQQVQQGIDHYHAGDYQDAIPLWKAALTLYQQTGDQANTAIVLENLARAYQHLGQTEEELATWAQLITLQRQQGNSTQIARLLVEQAQALSRSGQVNKAISLLCKSRTASNSDPAPSNKNCTPDSALKLAETDPDPNTKIAALGSLGDAYRLVGEYKLALAYLEDALKLAKANNHTAYQITTLQSLGNVYSRQAQLKAARVRSAEQRGAQETAKEFRKQQEGDITKALGYFRQSLELAQQTGNSDGQLKSLLASIPLQDPASSPVTDSLRQASQLLNQLPNSRERVYATIDLAHLYFHRSQAESTRFRCAANPSVATPQAEALLQQAVNLAQAIQDQRAKSFALGELGHLYECRQDYPAALSITQQAYLAAKMEADSRYLWEWQTGRILNAQTQTEKAIIAYSQAIVTLKPIRRELLTTNRDLQFDFRDAIEPLYREAIALQLSIDDQKIGKAAEATQPNAKNLKPQASDRSELNDVLTTVDSLRLAELENYFGSDCVVATVATTSDQGQQAMSSTAVFNTVILDDRSAVVVSFPGDMQQKQLIKRQTLAVDRATLQQVVNDYRRALEDVNEVYYTSEQAKKLGEKLYDWLIRPFAEDLERAKIKTLVFVQDGILRTVPMAALHDGNQFLIQKYAVVTAPSLALTDLQAPDRSQLRSLAMGSSQEATIGEQPFQALPNVPKELQAVQARLPQTQVLLDQDFTRDRLEQALRQRPYPILHMATHGQFGTDPADTFLVMGDRQKLTITDLESLIRPYARGQAAIDLLTLTACQTAVGDDRAALGLAGVALQAGVRSALASLWFIDDAATTQFVTQFYDSWRNTGLSKAEAVQKAQQILIASKKHPAYWAPFVLVGNWL